MDPQARPAASGALPASAVVLGRGSRRNPEIFWVRRSAEVSLGAGFHAFPGGRQEAADRVLGERWWSGDGTEGAARVAAWRELFEETGVLLQPAPSGGPAAGRAELRRALLEERSDLEQVLDALGGAADLAALQPAGRWITPPYLKRRFDTRFFLAWLPEGETAEVWPGELVDGEWLTPAEALERWDACRALLHPPALHLLRGLAQGGWPPGAFELPPPEFVHEHVARVLEFQGGVSLVPLLTPTLPPATHTHCYLLGESELLVVDPGAHVRTEQQYLFDVCAALQAHGRRVREILLTHEHIDHVGTAGALRERLGVPLRAHALTRERLRGRLSVDGTLEDGERLELPGRRPQSWRVLHTPGHARGHVCLFEERTRALVAGDMLTGEGTVLVPPAPEGDMADYVHSLERLAALQPGVVYPAHGPVIVDGLERIGQYLEHRAARERAVVAALGQAGRARAAELVPTVYSDVAPAAWGWAEQSLLAVLEKLVKEGRARLAGRGVFELTPPGPSPSPGA